MSFLFILNSKEALAAFQAVPKGFITPTEGVFGTTQDAKDILITIKGLRKERDIYKQGCMDRDKLLEESIIKQEESISRLQETINQDNKKYKQTVAKLNIEKWLYGIIGIAIGKAF